ncbi:MAG: fasciclin domain-containing protein [Nocardioidaceae bacterium]
MQIHRTSLAVASVASLALLTTACGGSSTPTSSSSNTSGSPSATDTVTTPSQSPSGSASGGSDPMAQLVGSGCAAYAKANATGAGSVGGMAQDPVGTAASNNPLLKTLTATVTGAFNKKVNLVDALNDPKATYTVFAPVDTAFAKLPASTLKTLATPAGAQTLSTVLTYHVLPMRLDPSQIDGTHKTLEGETLKVSGSGNSIKVNGSSAVICGGVQTANATVYLIDTVLKPPSM